VIWKRIANRTIKRVAVISRERHRKISDERWVLIRDNDGRVWAGPYRWQGNTFTEAQRFWYLFANVESARAAVAGNEFVGVTVKQIV
jgi:hypothetical protein